MVFTAPDPRLVRAGTSEARGAEHRSRTSSLQGTCPFYRCLHDDVLMIAGFPINGQVIERTFQFWRPGTAFIAEIGGRVGSGLTRCMLATNFCANWRIHSTATG